MSRARFFACAVVVCCAHAAVAADDDAIGLRMQTTQTTLKQGSTFQLDVILTVRGNDSVDELEMPDVSDFTLVREGQSQSASSFVRGGRRSVVVEHRRTLILRADEAGDLAVGEATARLGDQRARAAPLRIKVVAAGAAKPSAAVSNNSNGDDDDDDDEEEADADDNDAEDDDKGAAGKGAAAAAKRPGARFNGALPSVFLEVVPDKEKAFVGEQVTVVVEVWSQVPLGSYPRVPGLKPAGFVCLALDDGQRLQATQRSLDGQTFYVYPVTRDALFALAPGRKRLPVVDVEVSPAGSFFSRGQDVRVRSEALALDIQPLPSTTATGPVPDGFVDGNVGAFQLSVSVRLPPAPQGRGQGQGQVKVGEPFTLVVEATGHGNIDQLTLPRWTAPVGVRLFPPTVRRERRDRDGLVAGRVTEEVLVQPQEAGDVVIPPLRLVTFDPTGAGGDGVYAVSSGGSLTVRVVDAADSSGKAAKKKQRASATLASGPRPLQLDAPARDVVIGDGVVVGGAGAGVVFAIAGALLSMRRRQGDSATARRRRRHDERATAVRASRDVAALSRLLLDALAERAGEDVRATPLAELPVLLRQRGVTTSLAHQVTGALRAAEAARYAPGGAQQKARDDVAAAVLAVDNAADPSSDGSADRAARADRADRVDPTPDGDAGRAS